MGKTETENAAKFEPHTLYVFRSQGCPAALVSAWLIIEFHVTPCFWQDAGEKFHTLHIANSILEYIVFCVGGSNMPPVVYSPYSRLFRVTWPIQHTWGSHDQYRTLLESRDEYRTHFKSHNKHGYHYALCFIFIGTTHSAAFVNGWRREVATSMAIWTKVTTHLLWLILCRWQSPSLRLIFHPALIHPCKNYILIKAQKGLLYMN